MNIIVNTYNSDIIYNYRYAHLHQQGDASGARHRRRSDPPAMAPAEMATD